VKEGDEKQKQRQKRLSERRWLLEGMNVQHDVDQSECVEKGMLLKKKFRLEEESGFTELAGEAELWLSHAGGGKRRGGLEPAPLVRMAWAGLVFFLRP
jgi:hypothetical protein